MQFTKDSFNKFNNRFDSLEQRQNKLETMFNNINIHDDDKNAYNDRIKKKVELRKNKLNFDLFYPRYKNQKSNQHFFDPNDFKDNEEVNNDKDNVSVFDDEKDSIDIIIR